MPTIWKFPIHGDGWTDVQLNADENGITQLVLAAIDPASRRPAVWIAHDPDGQPKPMTRSFIVIGTGHPFPDSGNQFPVEHVGSMVDGLYVWHVFERTLTMSEAWASQTAAAQ